MAHISRRKDYFASGGESSQKLSIIKGAVSRDERGMLLYIFRKLLKNAIASDEKNVILLKGQLTMSI